MSNEKDISKELTDAVNKVLSRRDAVKKAGSIAAGAALAFLGLGMPGISQQREARACCYPANCFNDCFMSCTADCMSGCISFCSLGCGDACSENCSEGCGGNCMSCTGVCVDDCTGGCMVTCGGYCTGTESY